MEDFVTPFSGVTKATMFLFKKYECLSIYECISVIYDYRPKFRNISINSYIKGWTWADVWNSKEALVTPIYGTNCYNNFVVYQSPLKVLLIANLKEVVNEH